MIIYNNNQKTSDISLPFSIFFFLSLFFFPLFLLSAPLLPQLEPFHPKVEDIEEITTLGFLSPLLTQSSSQKLEEIKQKFTLEKIENPNHILLTFFLIQKKEAEGKVHAAALQRAELARQCEIEQKQNYEKSPPSFQARFAYLCAAIFSDSLSQKNLFSFLPQIKKIQQAISAAMLAPLSQKERLAAEAQLFSFFSPVIAQDFRRSLLAIQILNRLDPSLEKQNRQLLAHIYQVQRNQAAQKITNDDAPIISAQKRQEKLDRFYFGWGPFLSFSPAHQLQLGIDWIDEKLQDQNRKLAVQAWVSSLRHLGGQLSFLDREILSSPQHALGSSLAFIQMTESPEKMIPTQSLVSYQNKRVQRTAWELFYEIHPWISSPSAFRFGWETHSVLVAGQSTLYGPFVEWSRNDLDSLYSPHSGSSFFFRYYLSWNSSLHSSLAETTSRISTHFSKYIPLHWKSSLSVSLQYCGFFSHQNTSSSFLSSFPAPITCQLGGTYQNTPLQNNQVPLKGVRENRYQDQHVFGSSLQYHQKILNPLTSFLFLSAGSAIPTLDRLSLQTIRYGGGVGVDYFLSHYSRPKISALFGLFASELSFQLTSVTHF